MNFKQTVMYSNTFITYQITNQSNFYNWAVEIESTTLNRINIYD